MTSDAVIRVAVPVPLRQAFDFVMPPEYPMPEVGSRVLVPFGKQKLVGVVLATKVSSDYPLAKLKPIIRVLDSQSVFDDSLWQTLLWITRYYLAPIGEVFEAALPVLLRQDQAMQPAAIKSWRLSDYARSAPLSELERAPIQLAIIRKFLNAGELSAADFKDNTSSWRQAIKSLLNKGWLNESETIEQPRPPSLAKRSLPAPTSEQALAIEQLSLTVKKGEFSCTLLHGVTGSGKTRVYTSAMQTILEQGKQVLLLVPEIGLTPQLLERLEQDLPYAMAVLHSNLNDRERHLAWWQARNGSVKIVVGTRSALFCSFENLGLIVVDEEHDASYKQQDGVRYHARDAAIYRAKLCAVPIVLASATPGLETLVNAQQGRYQKLDLRERATQVPLPKVQLIDLNREPAADGLSPSLVAAIKATLADNKQVMLFLNRRGYAPVLYCGDCKHSASCHRCDSKLTLHQAARQMRCHHCGYQGPQQTSCSHCSSSNLLTVGEGTQRVETALDVLFPDARILRIDRDSTRRKHALSEALSQVQNHQVDIVLGTQLIAKGHDFPNVAMVGILDADAGLYSTDFRASESLFQQLIQVGGRAGRHGDAGRVWIQTHFPEHRFFDYLKTHDFDGFAELLKQERLGSTMPPYGFFILLRAESTHQNKAMQFLRRAREQMKGDDQVSLMDAVPAPMARRAGRYRAQLLLCSTTRSSLNSLLDKWLANISLDADTKKLATQVRWSIDVDPIDFY